MAKRITLESTVKDLKETPAGHDLLGALLNEKDETVLADIEDRGYINALITMANYGNEPEDISIKPISRKWWKEAVFYQVYTRSFKDSNGDGVGDLRGIIEKIDYLSDLGIDAIWISPFAVSPQIDNGYDISDFYNVDPLYGDMKDIEELISKAHEKNIKVITDIVFNHTSDKHPWFQDVMNNPESEYDDCYFITDKQNNWTSLFSGTAWSYLEKRNKYALHLYSEHQFDLNWHNKQVQDEGIRILNFWLNKGFDGFRFDSASLLSKDDTLPDGNEKLGKAVGFTGAEHYYHGPELDELYRRFRKESYGNFDSYTVGECGGHGAKLTYLLTAEERQEMDTVFNFDHTENPGRHRFDIYDYSLMHMIESLIRYREDLNDHCWNTVFIENHDSPRIPSKVRADNLYHNEISKLVNTVLLTLKGTPYLYQGQEIGMLNTSFNNMKEIEDVESVNKYDKLLEQGLDKDEAFKHILYGTRDHARTPMQWDEENSFSKVTPWLRYSNHPEINVLQQQSDSGSVLTYTKKIIKLRKGNSTFVYGKQDLLYKDEDVIIYERMDEENDFIIEVNTGDKELKHPLIISSEVLASNYDDTNMLKPYQVVIYKKTSS